MESLKNKFKRMAIWLNHWKYELALSAALSSQNSMAYAAGQSPKAMILSIVDKIVTLFPAIGVVLVAVGVIRLVLAFRGNNPEGYSDAAKDAVIGVALIVFDTFFWDGIKKVIGN